MGAQHRPPGGEEGRAAHQLRPAPVAGCAESVRCSRGRYFEKYAAGRTTAECGGAVLVRFPGRGREGPPGIFRRPAAAKAEDQLNSQAGLAGCKPKPVQDAVDSRSSYSPGRVFDDEWLPQPVQQPLRRKALMLAFASGSSSANGISTPIRRMRSPCCA